ncbi:hypothetical protein [Bosea sp. PAMC 26642]|uniref:hypothetical protein n=1 Tax=Bosea sp. (strain PAMC 26642) TaxID=1792307 RepID=UPI0012E76920|nr:hypothetical protein [Bosea sp. PAMC 26642]
MKNFTDWSRHAHSMAEFVQVAPGQLAQKRPVYNNGTRWMTVYGDRESAESLKAVRDDLRYILPTVFEIEADFDDIVVDGDMYLTPLFLRVQQPTAVDFLERIFGPTVRPYFLEALSSDNEGFRKTLAEAACQDAKVIASHLRNIVVLGCDYLSAFRSSFKLKFPVPPKSVVRAYLINSNSKSLDVERELDYLISSFNEMIDY